MRAALRQLRSTRMGSVRPNSTSSSSSPMQNPQVQKAMEGATKAYQQSAATVQRLAGPMGERVGSMLGGWREPIVFNAKVFGSLCRQVYHAEKMAFPMDLHVWTTAYAQMAARARSMTFWREVLRTGAWAGLAVGAVEAYGIFSIGEIIGRRNLVGYKLK